MTITVRLYATLRAYAEAGETVLDVPEGTTVGGLVEHLGIPGAAVRIVFVNGVTQDDAYVVKSGDEVGIFPPIAGGA